MKAAIRLVKVQVKTTKVKIPVDGNGNEKRFIPLKYN